MTTDMRIVTVVICDDVRIERSGKYILIGVYPFNNIGVPKLPSDVGFSCYVEITTERRGELRGTCRIINEDNMLLHSEPIAFVVPINGKAYLHFFSMSFNAKAPGAYRFQWELGTGSWEDITVIEVNLNPSAHTNSMNIA